MLKHTEKLIGKLVGFRCIKDFSKDMVKTKGFVYPSMFNRAVEMVINSGAEFQRSLELGLSGFRYFPLIKYWDASRHPTAQWNFSEYVELVQVKEAPSFEARAASLSRDVLSAVEQKELCFSQTVNKYRGLHLPWTKMFLRSLPEDMTREQTVVVLCFLRMSNFERLKNVFKQL